MIDIYPTHVDPQFCAMALDDRTLDKSIQATVRICANTITHFGGVAMFAQPNPGPWDEWARATYANYEWLNAYGLYLTFEWRNRGARPLHLSHHLMTDLAKQRHMVPNKGPQTMFPNCTRFVHILDPIVAYRLALSEKWALRPEKRKWGTAGAPPWIVKPEDLARVLVKLGCEAPPCN